MSRTRPKTTRRIVRVRANKIRGIADFIPELEVTGPEQGDLLVLGWGGDLRCYSRSR